MITFPGFLKAYESGRDEPSEEDEERRLPALTVGQTLQASSLEPQGHETSTARAVHGGEPRQGARGARHRPTLDVRLDHGDDPRPRLRLQEGHGARTDVRRVLGHPAAREALRPARRLRLHGPARGRPRPHRSRRRGARRLARTLLLRRRRPGPPRARHRPPRGHRRPRGELDRDPRLGHRRPRRPLRAVPRARRAAREPRRRPRARRAQPGDWPRSCSLGRPARSESSGRTRRRVERSSRRTAATGPT